MKYTEYLSELVDNIKTLSEKDVQCLRKLMLDFFAASFAGYDLNKEFNTQVESVIFPQGGAGEASVFLSSSKLPAGKAAFLNAIYAHGAELDDGNRKAAGHIGTHVFPAVFALAEKLESSEHEVLLALAGGYETYIRISSAAQPGLVHRGYHSTGMAGTLGCAAACAKLYGLSAKGIENAIALATTLTGGLLSYGDSRPAVKPLNPAKAAESGLLAASLSAAGMEGPEEALEGPNGWFHAASDTFDESMLIRKENEHLLIHECYYKLYPSCRHTHCGIEAGISLFGKGEASEIDRVNVYIYPNAIKLAGIQYPKTPDETKFSIAFTLACALSQGSYGIADMQKANHLPESLFSLIGKISLIPDESMEDREKGIRGARVEVIYQGGRSESETVLIPKGDPEKPLSFEDIEEKLYACAKNHFGREELDNLTEYIRGFGKQKRFTYPEI